MARPAVAQQKQQVRPWHMPHQLGDRVAGSNMARAVNAQRTPVGGFAVFDLAKAPK
jgi:hypothetical protein